jgi:hypothetical protein
MSAAICEGETEETRSLNTLIYLCVLISFLINPVREEQF